MAQERIIIKNKASIERMHEAGQRLAHIMEAVRMLIVVGENTHTIDDFIEKSMRSVGLKPECKGYAGYPYATCISLNDVIVHGMPSKEIILKSGDFVKIDVVGSYKGYCADITRYYFVGQPHPTAVSMAQAAQRALDAAIEKITPGIRLSDISFVIQQIVEQAGFSVIRDFAGHGIGKTIHEAPQIPNYGNPGKGPVLLEGMTLAIEPMIAEKQYDVRIMQDGWTAKTADGGLAAHVEDTVVVTKHGAEVLTRI